MTTTQHQLSYVLITPVRNEAAFVERTIRSIVSQTRLPRRWVIVDDGSTDATAEIVARLTRSYEWVELVRREAGGQRDFASKVRCFNTGYERVKGLDYDIIGNLDADISFDSEYLEFLLRKFNDHPNLGVAGTVFREENYSSDLQSFEGANHVAGGCQLFRRECFEAIGGYAASPCGGVDWVAVTTARMMGWTTRSFREKWFFHHRPLGRAGRGVISTALAYGRKDYLVGGHPLWEFLRVLYRMTSKPYVIGGVALGLGFLMAFVGRSQRHVSNAFVSFHRREQMTKLKSIILSLLKFKTIDPFRVGAR